MNKFINGFIYLLVILIVYRIYCIYCTYYSNNENIEGFIDVALDYDGVLDKIVDTPAKKLYMIGLNKEKYLWKHYRQLKEVDLHDFFKHISHIRHKCLVPVLGIMDFDDAHGYIQPIVVGKKINKYPYRKKVMADLVDAINYMDLNNLFVVPKFTNIMIDPDGNPQVINHFDKSLRNYRLSPEKQKENKTVMKVVLVNTILAIKHRIPEDQVLQNIHKLHNECPHMIDFMLGKTDISYNKIMECL